MNTTLSYQEQKTNSVREYTALESAFAWICYIAAYLFCRVYPVNESPLGGLLLTAAIYIATFVILKIKGTHFAPLPCTVALSAVVVASSLIVSDNPTIHFFAYTYALVSYCYFVSACLENRLKKDLCDLIVIDYIKSLFVLPFCSFGAIGKALFTGRAKKGGNTFAKILIGLAVAIVPTSIVLVLLSYDPSFNVLLEEIFDFNAGDAISHFFSFLFAFPLSAYGYGIFISACDGKCKDRITLEGCQKTAKDIKIAPLLTILASTLPILTIYVIFFVSQWKYYISGFTGVLPENLSYADYAREGFFQLCAVSVIDLIIIVLIMSLTKKENKACSVILKILCIIYSVATLVLIATALAKMIMYINYYGLTPKRVYVAWFEVVLAVVFLIVILKQFIPKLNAVAVSLAVLVVCFAALALSNVDGIIAEYNVDRYLDGTLDTVDLEMLDEMGDPAVPALVRLSDTLKERGTSKVLHGETEYIIKNTVREHESDIEDEDDIFSFTLPTYRARQAIKDRMELYEE